MSNGDENGDVMVKEPGTEKSRAKAYKADKADKADKAGNAAARARKPVGRKSDGTGPRQERHIGAMPEFGPHTAVQLAAAADAARDCTLETAVLLDSIIHDLRTPLSAMSGWLEVLEAHFGEADGIVGRALLGLRRGVDSQALGLSGLSDVLMKQRIDLPAQGDCILLERIQLALKEMQGRSDGPLDPSVSNRLLPLRSLDANGSLACQDAGTSLNEACGTLLRALAAAQDAADAPLSVSANADKVLITLPGGSGDPAALRSLCTGLAAYPTRRPDIRAQAIWLARSIFRRCGLILQMSPAEGGGFHLLLSKLPQA